MLVRRRTVDSSWSAGSLTPNSLARRSQPISASAWRRLASGCDVGGRAASRPSMRYRDVEQAIFWGEPCSTVAMVPTCSLRPRTRRAAFGGGFWPSLTFAARAGLPKGRSGRRDVGFRSNNRMTSGRCRSQPGNEGLAVARTKTDSIDALGIARFGAQKRPVVTRLPDQATHELRELVRHRDRLVADFGDRVRQLHRLVGLGFPEFRRHVKSLDSMLACTLLAEYPN